MSRWKASGIHLLISAAVAGALLTFMLTVWYPWPLFEAAGGSRLIFILAAVGHPWSVHHFDYFQGWQARPEIRGNWIHAAIQILSLTNGFRLRYVKQARRGVHSTEVS
jgi:hypothetical protein